MKTIQRTFLIVMICFTLAITAGCGSQVKYSGFLKDYPDFKPGRGVDLSYVKENVDFKYNKVMLDQVVFYFSKDAKYRGIHAGELQELADAFQNAMTGALEDGYPLVAEPGPNVLRIRCAITDVVATRQFWNTATTVTSVSKRESSGTSTKLGTTHYTSTTNTNTDSLVVPVRTPPVVARRERASTSVMEATAQASPKPSPRASCGPGGSQRHRRQLRRRRQRGSTGAGEPLEAIVPSQLLHSGRS